MSSQSFIAIGALLLGTFTVLMWWIEPKESLNGKTPLTWATCVTIERNRQIDDFNQETPDCLLRIDPNNQGVTKVVIQSTANMGPDLIDFVNEDTISIYHASGVLMDITDDAREMGFGPDTLPKGVRDLIMVKEMNESGEFIERQYCYPMNIYHDFIIYNKNIFDRLGIPYPSEDLTWEEYIDLGKKLTTFEGGNRDVPVIFGAAGVHLKVVLWEKGGGILNDDGTRSILDSPQSVEAACFYHDLFYKHKIEPPPTIRAGILNTGGSSNNCSLFGSGKLAMVWGARWHLMIYRKYINAQRKTKETWLKENPGGKYEGLEAPRLGACHVPRFKDGERYTVFGTRSTGVNAYGRHREKALKFLRYAAGPAYNQAILKIADSKPPNKKYYDLKLFSNADYPGEEDVHRLSIEAIPYGKVEPRSFFIDNATVRRYFEAAKDQIQSNPSLTRRDIAKICENAAAEINLTIARNINRDPKLRAIHRKLLGKDFVALSTSVEERQ